MNLLLVLMDVRDNLLRRDVVLWWGTCVLVTHVRRDFSIHAERLRLSRRQLNLLSM